MPGRWRTAPDPRPQPEDSNLTRRAVSVPWSAVLPKCRGVYLNPVNQLRVIPGRRPLRFQIVSFGLGHESLVVLPPIIYDDRKIWMADKLRPTGRAGNMPILREQYQSRCPGQDRLDYCRVMLWVYMLTALVARMNAEHSTPYWSACIDGAWNPSAALLGITLVLCVSLTPQQLPP